MSFSEEALDRMQDPSPSRSTVTVVTYRGIPLDRLNGEFVLQDEGALRMVLAGGDRPPAMDNSSMDLIHAFDRDPSLFIPGPIEFDQFWLLRRALHANLILHLESLSSEFGDAVTEEVVEMDEMHWIETWKTAERFLEWYAFQPAFVAVHPDSSISVSLRVDLSSV